MVVLGRPSPGDLTQREREVLALLSTHLRLNDIGRRLFVSENTVKSHVKSIYVKLGVTSRAGAVARAADLGILRYSNADNSPS